MALVSDIYGSMVFNEHTMQERLPSATYKKLMKTIKDGQPLDLEVANVVAHAMKEWAIEKGATHYTHWFQPHDRHHRREARRLHRPVGRRRRHHGVLRQGADPGRAGRLHASPPAACAPPLRRAATPLGTPPPTPSSKTNALCIPTAFCSYTGEALDKKTPAAALHGGHRATRPCACCALFGKQRAPRDAPPWAPSRSTS